MGHDVDNVFCEASALCLEWARKALPFYGNDGSMIADLEGFELPDGPSYYNQFAHWTLLLLAEGILPGASAEERAHLRQCAIRNINYVLSITDEDFCTPHYSRGRTWGRHAGEWSNFFLLRSLQVLEARQISGVDVARLTAAIRGACSRIAAAFERAYGPESSAPDRFPGNHPTWHALLLYEAGAYYSVPGWRDLAQHFMRRWVLPFQLPCGTWPEGGGIVVNYAMVTAQALSLYAEAAGDNEVRTAVGRFFSFAKTLSFPDGSSSVSADCRMRYHRKPSVFLPPTFLRIESGTDLCCRRLTEHRRLLPELRVETMGVQALAFLALLPEFIARRNGVLGGDTLPAPAITDLPVGRIDHADWTGFVSAQLTAEPVSRFHLDAQNMVELWHRHAGYIVGGGNSKFMPRFSTFRRRNYGRAYIPCAARLVPGDDPHRLEAEYVFEGDRLGLILSLSPSGAAIAAAVLELRRPGALYEAALTLPLKPGESLLLGGRDPVTIRPAAMVEHAFSDGGSFRWRDRTFEVPPGARLDYPVVPHNPYRQDGLPEPDAYVARLAWPVTREETVVRVT